jgi:nucleoside-diphosphate-sugar epimerase
MRVFVTGATGFIGSAVVRELLEAGHQVVGLARSDTAAPALTAAGAEVHRGALDDLDSLRAAAAAAEGVIHLAFEISKTEDFAAASQGDLRAVEAMGSALEGSDRPLVVTSGTLALAPGRLGTEEDAPDPASAGGARVPTELAAVAMGELGVRSSVVRLPPTVHDEGDKTGLVPRLIGVARATGVSAFVGDGSNRWPAVHRSDAAHLFRLAVEAAPAGSRLHGAGEEGVTFREIAEAIGRQLNLPVTSIAAEGAPEHFGFSSFLVSVDNPTSSALTRDGWAGGPTARP